MGTYNWLARLHVVACWLHYTDKYVISIFEYFYVFDKCIDEAMSDSSLICTYIYIYVDRVA